ncbi:MAG: tetratricopeptide repeat protein [Rhodocyclales bacterium]|nr:tetratricopeptide repeat protein [Rhodocyclales bacterium]
MIFRTGILLATALASAILVGCASTMTPQETAAKAQKHIAQGEFHARNGRYSLAKLEYRKAASLEPNNAIHWALAADSARRSGDLQEAIEYYQTASDLKPNDPRWHQNLGAAYHVSKMDDEAIVEFKKAIELGGLNPWTAGALAEIYCTQGYMAPCFEYLRKFDETVGKQDFAAMTDAQKSALTNLKDKIGEIRKSSTSTQAIMPGR